jgi:hypothetical protein
VIVFLEVVLYGAFALWGCYALARLQAAWDQSQRRVDELREALTAAGLRLESERGIIRKLEGEAARVKQDVMVAGREQKERHETLARATRPPPPEVRVISEYPAARGDAGWIADFMRDSEEPAQPWERAPATLLFWASTQVAAVAAARHLIRAHRNYRVSAVRPLA